MNHTRNILLAEFLTLILICLILVALYENDILLGGSRAADTSLDYYAALCMELVTICLIPLALRLFRFGSIRRRLTGSPARSLTWWGSCRLMMIGLPMVANTWLYYQFMNVAFGYMAIIGLLSLCFIYPSHARCNQEVSAL